MPKKINEKFQQEVDQFREDVKELESIYLREKIANTLEQGKENFGKYINGRLTPPKALIDLFYKKYQPHLEWHRGNAEKSTGEVQDVFTSYGLGVQLETILGELKEIRKKIEALPTSQTVTDLSARVENLEKQVLPPSSPPSET